jgi:Rieske Fe-S protein
MFNDDSSSPDLTNITFENNSADYGGGMFVQANSNPTLVNVTFVGNAAMEAGGGMLIRDGSNDLVLTNVTFSNNSASIGGGIDNGGSPVIRNTIIWGNTGGEIVNNGPGIPDVSYSIVQDGFTGTGNLDVDPLLGPLANNGGFTQTMALLPGSPAIDAGDDGVCPDTDQRGVTRPQGSHCDIGAYEYEPLISAAIVDVTIGGNPMGESTLESGNGMMQKYLVDGGPVEISAQPGAKIIASLNQWRKRPGTSQWTGVSQSLALPVDQVSNIYVMPRYDYSNPTRLYNAVLLANVDTVPRDITVTIGGMVMGTYTISPSQSEYKTYSGVAGGPVVVSSDSGAKIIASIYELRRDPNFTGWNGQSEMMGLPWEGLSDSYVIPIYFGAPTNQNLDARLFIANADTVARDVTVKIGGVVMGTHTLQPSSSKVVKYAVDGGPVEISAQPGAKIIASLNQWRKRPGTSQWTGVSQSLVLPVDQVSNIYVMPRYDYSNPTRLYNAVLLANVDTVPRDITVTIGGMVMGTYTIGPSQSEYKTYSGVAGGPVVVSSDSGAKIIASIYELRRDPNFSGWNGQSEMMGLPWEELSDSYVIPIYFGAPTNQNLDARLFIAVP